MFQILWSETYLEYIDEFWVADVSVLVGIELVKDDTEFLSGEEYAKFWQKFLKFKLVEDSILISVKALWKTGK